MKYIDIAVIGRRAKAAEGAEIICENSDYSVRFSFDEEWKESPVKTARFVFRNDNGKQCVDRVFEGDTVVVPVMANTLEVFVGVYAGDLKTTTPARIPCTPSIRCGSAAPVDPEPSVYDQIMELLNRGGGGNGRPGEDGVSPTVEITETENGHQVKITDVEGEHVFEVMNGRDGEDGYTPQKGVDYFDGKDGEPGPPGETGPAGPKGEAYTLTEADKTAIAEQAAALIDTSLSAAIGSGVLV